MNYTDLSPRLHSKLLKCQSAVVKHKRSETETALLYGRLQPPPGPGRSLPSPSGIAETPERSPGSAASGVQTRPRLGGGLGLPAPARPYLRTHLAAHGTAEAWPEPAAGQLPPPRAPAAGSRLPRPGPLGGPSGRRQGPEAEDRRGAGWAATCEQKYEPWMPSLMQVGHWSLASLLQPSVSHTRVSTAAMLPGCRRREEPPQGGERDPAGEELRWQA
jgi:hypothetical protein